MSGKTKPNYSKTVDLLTKSAIKEMIIPSLLPVLAPIIFYIIIEKVAGRSEAFISLGAMLLGVIITGLYVAISMTSGGGAWDNAKKYIEDGNHGGKGSDAPQGCSDWRYSRGSIQRYFRSRCKSYDKNY